MKKTKALVLAIAIVAGCLAAASVVAGTLTVKNRKRKTVLEASEDVELIEE